MYLLILIVSGNLFLVLFVGNTKKEVIKKK